MSDWRTGLKVVLLLRGGRSRSTECTVCTVLLLVNVNALLLQDTSVRETNESIAEVLYSTVRYVRSMYVECPSEVGGGKSSTSRGKMRREVKGRDIDGKRQKKLAPA